MPSLFLSYSRKDLEFARRLTEAFRNQNLDFGIDWADIPPNLGWRIESLKGIEEADIFIFLLSPESADSKVCKEELDYAVRSGKRLITIVMRDVQRDKWPEPLKAQTFIYFRESDDSEAALKTLLAAIQADYELIRSPIQLQVKALEWERNNYDNGFLLRGKELDDAQFLLSYYSAMGFSPTKLQIQFLAESQKFFKNKRKSNQLHVFLSYDEDDRNAALELDRKLNADGFDVLLGAKSLLSGQAWFLEIRRAIQAADVILVLLSNRAVVNDVSVDWTIDVVRNRAWEIQKGKLLIIPVRLEVCPIPRPLDRFQWIDLFVEGGYENLKKSLEYTARLSEGPSPNPPSPHMAAPPPVLAPAPFPNAPPMPKISRFLGWVLLAILIVVLSMIIYPYIRNLAQSTRSTNIAPFFLTVANLLRGVAVAILFILIPYWAMKLTEYKSRFSQSLMEIFLFSVILSIVALFMFRLRGSGAWMMYAIGILTILDGGGYLLDYLREKQIARIGNEIRSKQKTINNKKKTSKLTKRITGELAQYQNILIYINQFDQLFSRERLLYVALPLGILSGDCLSIYKHSSIEGYLENTILFISLFAALVLAYFVYRSFRQLMLPVYTGEKGSEDLVVFTSSELEKLQEERESAIGFGKTTTELRELYLYDSAHNTLLLSIFLYIFLASINIILSWQVVAFIVLVLLTTLTQLPFVVGQSQLRQHILNRYGGYARGIMESELKKDEIAPLLRKPEFFAALFTLGTGGLLFALAENFIKALFK